ncbi:MAG: type II secretion system F family protein [Pseudobdellovibrionaceae bacterium]
MLFGEQTDQMLIIGISALVAAGSFVAVAYPYLNRQEKKERYEALIQKKRKALFDATREAQGKKGEPLSAKDSLSAFFKFQQLFGEYGEALRSQMLQAGIRDPKAPMMYMMARIILPTVLMLCTWIVMAKGDMEFSGVQILLAMGVIGTFAFFLPRILVKNHIIKRQEEINLTFPDALDMMLICVQGGIGLEQTINRIAEEIAEHSPTLAEELGILSAEMGMLNDRRRALQDFARRVGSGAAKSFATAMIQAEQYGTSVSSAMRVIAEDLRDQRMAEAERKAAALPPKLTVPMILFFLPALFIVILAPAVIQARGAGL